MVDTSPPKTIYYSIGGNLRTISWFDEKGRYHREGDKPAYIEYYNEPGNIVMKKEWYYHGTSHREKGPAKKHYTMKELVDQLGSYGKMVY